MTDKVLCPNCYKQVNDQITIQKGNGKKWIIIDKGESEMLTCWPCKLIFVNPNYEKIEPKINKSKFVITRSNITYKD